MPQGLIYGEHYGEHHGDHYGDHYGEHYGESKRKDRVKESAHDPRSRSARFPSPENDLPNFLLNSASEASRPDEQLNRLNLPYNYTSSGIYPTQWTPSGTLQTKRGECMRKLK